MADCCSFYWKTIWTDVKFLDGSVFIACRYADGRYHIDKAILSIRPLRSRILWKWLNIVIVIVSLQHGSPIILVL